MPSVHRGATAKCVALPVRRPVNTAAAARITKQSDVVVPPEFDIHLATPMPAMLASVTAHKTARQTGSTNQRESERWANSGPRMWGPMLTINISSIGR